MEGHRIMSTPNYPTGAIPYLSVDIRKVARELAHRGFTRRQILDAMLDMAHDAAMEAATWAEDHVDEGAVAEVIPIERSLEMSASLIDEAKAIGCNLEQAAKIVRWTSMLSDSDREMVARTAERLARRRA